jgi:hypothetical protein
MEKIALTQSGFNQVAGLASLLMCKGYFSYLGDALAYANALADFVYTIPHKNTIPPSTQNMADTIADTSPTSIPPTTLLSIR